MYEILYENYSNRKQTGSFVRPGVGEGVTAKGKFWGDWNCPVTAVVAT